MESNQGTSACAREAVAGYAKVHVDAGETRDATIPPGSAVGRVLGQVGGSVHRRVGR